MRQFAALASAFVAITFGTSASCLAQVGASAPQRNADMIDVRLPAAVDPSRSVVRLSRGTRIFSVRAYSVFYTRTVNGRSRDFGANVDDVAAIERKPTVTILHLMDGSVRTFPADAQVDDGKAAWSMAFVAPGQRVPPQFANRAPDYAVP